MHITVLQPILLAILLAGCFSPPGTNPECQGVTTEVCREAATFALDSLSPDAREGARALAVRPTASSVCNDDDNPVLDVDVQPSTTVEPLVITLGRDTRGRLVACTY